MESTATRISIWGVFVTVAAFLGGGCGGPAPAAPQATPPSVTVSKPVTEEVTDYYTFPGQTAAVGEVQVRARVSGYIIKVNFQDGQDVKAGDVLFEIDPRPYKAALDRAVAELARSQALLAKSQAKLSREERLRPTGAVSQEDYEDSLSQLAVVKASIQAAEAAVRDAELNLEYTRVVSPITGQVSRARVTEGNLVQPGDGDANVLTTVVTIQPIYVYFNVEERAYVEYKALTPPPGETVSPNRVKELGIPVEIGMANEQGYPHTGILDFVDNKVSTTTGTIRVRGVFENGGRALTPGLFVRVRLPVGKPHPALLVNECAIGVDHKQKYVLVVNDQKVVERRPIKVGALQDSMRVIESGLNADDLVIVNGLMRARPGTTVAPHFAEDAPATPGLADVSKPHADAKAKN